MAIDGLELRNTFGRFATGVCVITAAPEGMDPLGMTVNSFTSVSLDPPLLLWSLQNDSDCFPAFEKCNHFAVNVLAASQLDISNRYAKKNEHSLHDDDVISGDSGIPLIKGALASFECKDWARYEGGDHQIIVGEVTHFRNSGQDLPLLFFSGAYAAMAS